MRATRREKQEPAKKLGVTRFHGPGQKQAAAHLGVALLPRSPRPGGAHRPRQAARAAPRREDHPERRARPPAGRAPNLIPIPQTLVPLRVMAGPALTPGQLLLLSVRSLRPRPVHAWLARSSAAPPARQRHAAALATASWPSAAAPCAASMRRISTAQEDSAPNMELDPAGVDESMFEAPTDEYVVAQPRSGAASTATGPEVLLLDLLAQGNAETATNTLRRLVSLGTPVRPHAQFAAGVLFAAAHPVLADERDVLRWLALMPCEEEAVPLMVSALRALQARAGCSVVTLARALELVTRAGFLHSSAYPQIASLLAFILRYTGDSAGSDGVRSSSHVHIWRAVSAAYTQSPAGAVPPAERRPLEKLFNSAVRALALAGRLNAAHAWACLATSSAPPDGAKLSSVTVKMLMEQLQRGSPQDVEGAARFDPQAAAQSFASRLAARDMPKLAKVAAAQLTPAQLEAPALESSVDFQIVRHLLAGESSKACDALLARLAAPAAYGRADTHAHLPSASILARLVWGSSPLGADQAAALREALSAARAGRGLWETAELHAAVSREDYAEAHAVWARSFSDTPALSTSFRQRSVENTAISVQTDAAAERIWPSKAAVKMMLHACAQLPFRLPRRHSSKHKAELSSRTELMYTRWLATTFDSPHEHQGPASAATRDSAESIATATEDDGWWHSLLALSQGGNTQINAADAPSLDAQRTHEMTHAHSMHFEVFLDASLALLPQREHLRVVLRFVGDMRERNVQPSLRVHNRLLKGVALAHGWAQSQKRARAMGMDGSRPSLPGASLTSYSMLLDALMRARSSPENLEGARTVRRWLLDAAYKNSQQRGEQNSGTSWAFDHREMQSLLKRREAEAADSAEASWRLRLVDKWTARPNFSLSDVRDNRPACRALVTLAAEDARRRKIARAHRDRPAVGASDVVSASDTGAREPSTAHSDAA